MIIYGYIYLAAAFTILVFCEPKEKLGIIVGTALVVPFIGRVLGWW